MNVSLLPMGAVPPELLARLSRRLAGYGVSVAMLPRAEVPAEALDARRHRYRAEALLPRGTENVLAVTTADLYTEGYDFILGLANAGSGGAVVSVHRLSAPDPGLVLDRLVKESAHELGHTWGLAHCDDGVCVMRFSNSLAETDAKGARFCRSCEASLPDGVASPPIR